MLSCVDRFLLTNRLFGRRVLWWFSFSVTIKVQSNDNWLTIQDYDWRSGNGLQPDGSWPWHLSDTSWPPPIRMHFFSKQAGHYCSFMIPGAAPSCNCKFHHCVDPKSNYSLRATFNIKLNRSKCAMFSFLLKNLPTPFPIQ